MKIQRVVAGPNTPAPIDLIIYGRAGWSVPFRFKDATDTPLNLTGYTFLVTFENQAGKTTPPDMELGSGLTVTGTGELTLTIDTDTLDFSTTHWQLDATPSGSLPRRWIEGVAKYKPEIPADA